MVRRAKCFDPLHDSAERRAMPGWQDIIGYRLDRVGREEDPPITQDGMLCGACGSVRQTTLIADLTDRRIKAQAVRTKLKTLGFTDDDINMMCPGLDPVVPAVTSALVSDVSRVR